jgi:CHAT domain-containing protein
LQDERVSLAGLTGQPVRLAEARLARAQLLAGLGKTERAHTDVNSTQAIVARLVGVPRRWMETELRFARAGILARTHPKQAAENLDSILSQPDSTLTAPRRLRARVGRAQVRLALGDTRGATADLDAASALLAEQRDSITASGLRVSLLETARGVFDQLAMLRVSAGDAVGGLRYVERGRAWFGPTAHGRGRSGQDQWLVRRGEVAVEYALAGDTLVAWTITRESVGLVRQTVNHTEMVESIRELDRLLEQGSDDASVHRMLAALYKRFVQPLDGHLGSYGTTLVLVVDGELAGIPFAGLFDARSGQYLVAAHPLRYAGSLRDGTRPHARPRGGTALLVSNPEFDVADAPALPRLPGTRAEVDSIAATWPRHRVLDGPGAMASTITADLPGVRVVHFAGHAVFDDQRPERSFLLLAPEHGRSEAHQGWLTAAEMERLPLGNVDLFVLSACRTLRARDGRSGGFAGFAGALLDAGVGGVVGSLWEANDGDTTPLMAELHRAYRRSGDGARSLQEAQLRMLRSSNPTLRAPAAWAGFRYAGN